MINRKGKKIKIYVGKDRVSKCAYNTSMPCAMHGIEGRSDRAP